MSMSKAQAMKVADGLLACPFCGNRLEASIRGPGENAVNPKAKCVTEDCMGTRLPVICLDVPSQVEAWNRRANTVTSTAAGPGHPVAEAMDKTATAEDLAEYARLRSWRARWGALANKREPGRLQSRQERIERRAVICNNKIRALMRDFDIRVGNRSNAGISRDESARAVALTHAI